MGRRRAFKQKHLGERGDGTTAVVGDTARSSDTRSSPASVAKEISSEAGTPNDAQQTTALSTRATDLSSLEGRDEAATVVGDATRTCGTGSGPSGVGAKVASETSTGAQA